MPFMSMVIVLPNDCDGLQALQNALVGFNLATFDEYMERSVVYVTIPKFKTKSSFMLNEPLEQVSLIHLRKENTRIYKEIFYCFLVVGHGEYFL